MTSRSLSGAAPGGERRPETGLRGAKRTPRRSQEPSIQFSNCPFLAQSALLRPTWRPRRPRRSPEARLGLPRTRNCPGGSNLTPGAFFFGPSGVAFFNRLRRTFARRWGHTVPTILSYCVSIFSWYLFHCRSISVCCARLLWSVLCLHVSPYLARRNARSD